MFNYFFFIFSLQLRVAQVTNGAASKLGRIRLVRKNVARVLTVINQKSLDAMKNETSKNKRLPKQLRARKTRAIRRQLTPAQAANVTLKAQKKAENFAVRKFALKA